MKWIGLTGGIATGKSAAKKIIESFGHPVIDADLIAHKISQPSQLGFERIRAAFGAEILLPDGSIDRKKLGGIIFQSELKKIELESLLHPIIQDEVILQRKHYEASGHGLCFYDVPLLFEKKLQRQFVSTILIWCDFETQLDRLKSRNSLSTAEAMARINSQLPLSEKLPLATYCIDNSTSFHSLQVQIESRLRNLSQK
jgi:dephospho-CoA kinase